MDIAARQAAGIVRTDLSGKQPRQIRQNTGAERKNRAGAWPALSIVLCEGTSPHRAEFVRRDLEQDALLARLSKGIFVLVEILLGHLVDVG